MRVDVWVSIGVNIEVDDPENWKEVAEKAKDIVQDKIENEGLYEHIEEVTPYDPETGSYDQDTQIPPNKQGELNPER